MHENTLKVDRADEDEKFKTFLNETQVKKSDMRR